MEDTESSQAMARVTMLKTIYKWIKCFSLQVEINTVSLHFNWGTDKDNTTSISERESWAQMRYSCTRLN